MEKDKKVLNIEALQKEKSSCEADDIDLAEMGEVLKLRIKIARLLEQREDLDEESKIVFAETNDLDLLRGILEVLEDSCSEDTISLFHNILGLVEDFAFYDYYIEELLCYYWIKSGCPYPQVMRFLDNNVYWFVKNDAIEYITDLLWEYNKENIKLPFSAEFRERLEKNIPCLVGTRLFDTKDEDSIIEIINGIFIQYNPIHQMRGQSFDSIIKVAPRKDDGNIVPVQKVKKE